MEKFYNDNGLLTPIAMDLEVAVRDALNTWIREHPDYSTFWVCGVASMCLSKGEVRRDDVKELVDCLNTAIDNFYEDWKLDAKLPSRWSPVPRAVIHDAIANVIIQERLRRKTRSIRPV